MSVILIWAELQLTDVVKSDTWWEIILQQDEQYKQSMRDRRYEAATAYVIYCVLSNMLLILRTVSETVDLQSQVHIRFVAVLCAQIGSWVPRVLYGASEVRQRQYG